VGRWASLTAIVAALVWVFLVGPSIVRTLNQAGLVLDVW
jgi:hypothetical protein